MGPGTNHRTDVLTTFHFYIDGISHAVFTEVSGLEVELEVMNYEEGGVNDHVHRLPGRARVSDITLRNGVTVTNELWNWYRKILQGTFERRNISIIMVDQHQVEKQRWNFIQALPIKWSGPQFRAGQSATAIQTLVLTHKGMQIS